MNKEELITEVKQTIINALSNLDSVEVRQSESFELVKKINKIVELIDGYEKENRDKESFLKDVSDLINSTAMNPLTNKTFKLKNIIGYQSRLISINKMVITYLNEQVEVLDKSNNE